MVRGEDEFIFCRKISSHRHPLSTEPVWSYGIFLVEVLTCKPPFPELPSVAVAMHNASKSPIGSILLMDKSWPPTLSKLIHACLQFEPKMRPSFTEIVDMLASY
jgi:serine/threonine protein kinase